MGKFLFPEKPFLGFFWVNQMKFQDINKIFRCTEIANSRLENTQENPEKLLSLEDLNVNFARCRKVGDWELGILGRILNKSPSLRKLRLNGNG